MRLRDIEDQMQPELLERLLAEPAWQGVRQQGRSWLEAQGSEEALAEARRQLPQEAAETLSLILRCFVTRRFSAEQLLRAGADGPWSGLELRYGLQLLHSCGIIWSIRVGWGEQVYAMPRESYPCWLRVLAPPPSPVAAQSGVRRLPGERMNSPLICEAVHLLAVLARSGYGFTRSGRLPRLVLQRLERQLAVPDAAVDGLPGIAGAPAQGASPALGWLLDLCVAQRWLTATEAGYVPDDERWHSWLTQPMQTCEAELIRFVLAEYAGGSEALACAAAALSEQTCGSWHSTDELSVWACRTGGDAAGPGSLELLERLSRLGWLELGIAADGSRLYRWTVSMQPAATEATALQPERLRIQRSGELIVTRECSLQVRWLLEMTAERISHELYTTYKMTAESVAAACGRGWNAAALIEQLSAAAGVPLEPTYAAMLRQWGAESAPADASQERTSREGRKESTARQVMSDARSVGDEPTLLPPCETPTLARLLPDLPELPAAWVHRLGRYHPSTAREMIEVALQRQLPLQLGREAELVVLIPERLQQQEDGWVVSGRLRAGSGEPPEQVCWTPEMWDEMRLHLSLTEGAIKRSTF